MAHQRDKDVLCALLFLARQIYTTHEGLAVMTRKYNLVTLTNEVLTTSGVQGVIYMYIVHEYIYMGISSY